ncbi:acyl-ACP--UDP-N-acetylglucosamine O-acyltransferase [Cerasicoccus arenae]|uniref:Acyl-[acyl-carrier-protein]--UDP-N-acetylglucosamine O-acyltransferase n=1 Tax=Cerasicoccus arenae TaxID=424488 RepID=A0A8J3D8U9_9BACT|nr:acyl-ACP--UDP-N-acetylglucosamine O-acyltransferase [Cerasicoccus arenae]MBK1856877.1 acyl-ACP--UDP-N-acetylglucosamine O-acyltransferase [Cerasicoccus arenae]GHB89615.1 acyl-[acyl-carrier-protein]--UDP-N-acetylglucosamine O-acyltransferase [Cerasicoccus arenae]
MDTTNNGHSGIEDYVQMGEGVVISPFAVVKSGSVLGAEVTVDHFAVIGGNPQYLRFDPRTQSGVRVGTKTVIREGVTINRSIHTGHDTTIGGNGFLMANCHVGHDCVVGDYVVLANGVLLGGHVTVGDHVFIGGNSAVHQFCRIGESAMIGGVARITYDVPPFVMAANENEVAGLNLIGLKRRGFTEEEISDLKRCYRAVYLGKLAGSPVKKADAALAENLPTTDRGKQFLNFFTYSDSRGFIRSRASTQRIKV